MVEEKKFTRTPWVSSGSTELQTEVLSVLLIVMMNIWHIDRPNEWVDCRSSCRHRDTLIAFVKSVSLSIIQTLKPVSSQNLLLLLILVMLLRLPLLLSYYAIGLNDRMFPESIHKSDFLRPNSVREYRVPTAGCWHNEALVGFVSHICWTGTLSDSNPLPHNINMRINIQMEKC